MTNNTFPRVLRLLNSRDFDQVFKNPVRASAQGMLVLAKNNNLDKPRLGLVISKKVLKRAVWRNRIKRIVRETFRNSQDNLPKADLVFIARPKIGDISNSELSSTLQRLWNHVSRRLDNPQS